MICEKCGTEIPDGNELCIQCTKIQISDDMVNVHTETPRKKKRKVLIPITVMIAIIILAVGSMLVIKYNNEKNGYFRDAKWGMNIDEVEKLEKGVRRSSSDDLAQCYIDEFDGFKGLKSDISYHFEDDKLCNISIFIITNDSSYTNESVIKTLEKKYTKLFGSYEDNGYICKWVTPKSIIELHYNTSEGMIYLTFWDIDKKEY